MSIARIASAGLVVLLAAACAAPGPSHVPSRAPATIEPAAGPATPIPAATAAPRPSPTAVANPPSATTSPTPTVAPTPTPTPSVPADLPRVAVVERDGIRVKIELERNPMPTGRVTRVRTTVRNLLDEPLIWGSDGCATSVHVRGVAAEPWRPGIVQEGWLHPYKISTLEYQYVLDTPSPELTFVPLALVGGPSYGCADVGLGHRIGPGDAIHATRAWSGYADEHWGPFPTGPILLRASFGNYRRPGEPAAHWPDIPVISVALPAWVTGGSDASWLSPAEVLDVALADPAFGGYIETHDVRFNTEEILAYRPELGAWEVGLARRLGDGRGWRAHILVIDPITGSILERIRRRWDPRSERT